MAKIPALSAIFALSALPRNSGAIGVKSAFGSAEIPLMIPPRMRKFRRFRYVRRFRNFPETHRSPSAICAPMEPHLLGAAVKRTVLSRNRPEMTFGRAQLLLSRNRASNPVKLAIENSETPLRIPPNMAKIPELTALAAFS